MCIAFESSVINFIIIQTAFYYSKKSQGPHQTRKPWRQKGWTSLTGRANVEPPQKVIGPDNYAILKTLRIKTLFEFDYFHGLT